MAKRWVCPHCDHAATIQDHDFEQVRVKPERFGKDGKMDAVLSFYFCPYPECGQTTINLLLQSSIPSRSYGGSYTTKTLNNIRLRPPSYAHPMPEYVPEAIRSDYIEACAIADLSPKASATLARRALQGMIRDFFGVSKHNLYQEIEAIRDKLDPLTWQAIDALRKLGNIGAHMEKDINTIVEVDPDEAVKLIRLIEMLIKDWYVAKHQREQNLVQLIGLGEEKQKARNIPNDRSEKDASDNTSG